MKEFYIIGSSPVRVDALEKVTGKAMYTGDHKSLDLLHLKAVRSPYAAARILKIDTSKAEKLSGVKGIVRPEDAPDKRFGSFLLDRYLLPRDNIVRHVGEAVALVAAETLDIAEEAADLVKVNYEELPAVFDVEEASKKEPPAIVHPQRSSYTYEPSPRYPEMLDPDVPNLQNMAVLRTGDIKRGFKEADLIVENKYICGSIQPSPLEPHIAEAWLEVDGTLVVRTSHQGYYFLRRNLSQFFGLPISKVRVLGGPYIGGGFGSKLDRLMALQTALAAIKLGKRVRLSYTRAEDLITGGRRPGMVVYMKHGVKKDGTLVAVQAKLIIDGGAYGHMLMGVIPRTALSVIAPTYRIPNIWVDSYVVYTNQPPCCTIRGVESPEVHFAIEQQMDIIAEKLGINPIELRRKNILTPGEENGFGEKVESIGVRECLDKVVDWIEWGKKPRAEGKWARGKGIAMGGEMCGRGYAATSTVKVHPDGTFEVTYGAADMGQGANTVAAQIVAEEFKVPLSKVKVVFADTDRTTFDWDNQASRTTISSGNAVLRACRDAKRQILELAAVKMGLAPADLDIGNGKIYWTDWPKEAIPIESLFTPLGFVKGVGQIIGRGEFNSAAPPLIDPKIGRYEKFVFWGYGAHAAEVAVNLETGQVKVLRMAAALDMGQPINLKMCQQQIEGGIGMGIGTAIYEELRYDKGKLVNQDLGNYKIPSFVEIPSGQNIASLTAGDPLKEGPYGAKGFSEAVMAYALAAIANAVSNAIGIRCHKAPLSRENVLEAIKRKKKS